MKIANFFTNDKGEIKVIQPPNFLLLAWLVVQAVSLFVFQSKQPALAILAAMLLFAWAYNELRQGESPFRKALGGIVLLILLIYLFMRWQ